MTCAGAPAATAFRWHCGVSDASVTVGWAAGVFQLAAEPAQPVLQQRDRVLALRGGYGCIGGIGRVQQLNQGGRQLFGRAPLRLALERVPLAVVDGEQPMQGLRRFSAAFGPLLTGRHWTQPRLEGHPGAMQQRPRSPHTPIRWLHQLANLMAQVSRAERITSGDESLQARRLRQRMALAQRLLDPLPAPLRPTTWQETSLWTALRWGGLGLVLALWLKR